MGLPPLLWMTISGASIYIAFIPPGIKQNKKENKTENQKYNLGATFYDRLNGATGVGFTTVFMMYFSDLFAYAATLSILLYRNFGPSDMSFLFFFQLLSIIVSGVGVILLCFATAFFWVRLRKLAHTAHHSKGHDHEHQYKNVLPDGVLMNESEDINQFQEEDGNNQLELQEKS